MEDGTGADTAAVAEVAPSKGDQTSAEAMAAADINDSTITIELNE